MWFTVAFCLGPEPAWHVQTTSVLRRRWARLEHGWISVGFLCLPVLSDRFALNRENPDKSIGA
jgi:hypothetical protein